MISIEYMIKFLFLIDYQAGLYLYFWTGCSWKSGTCSFQLFIENFKTTYVFVFIFKFGLIRGLAEGVESLFYEPYAGAIQGPGEFAEGVALGVEKLLGKTLGKLSTTAECIHL